MADYVPCGATVSRIVGSVREKRLSNVTDVFLYGRLEYLSAVSIIICIRGGGDLAMYFLVLQRQ